MPSAPVPLPVQILLAGISNSCAAVLTNPIDVIKVRLQLDGEGGGERRLRGGVRAAAAAVIREGGPAGLSRGLAPSVARDATYGGLRLGLYEPFKAALHRGDGGRGGEDGKPGSASASSSASVPYPVRFAAGAASGMVAAALTNPADLLKVRMQARTVGDGVRVAAPPGLLATLAEEGRALQAESRQILRSEGGVAGLWQGASPNVARAALVSASQIGTYDTSKSVLRETGWFGGATTPDAPADTIPLHLAASMVAGVAAAVVTSPVDGVKTRLMAQRARVRAAAEAAEAAAVERASGRGLLSSPPTPPPSLPRLYRGMLDCFVTTVRTEGALALYKGFTAQWLRLGPHTIVTFLVFEQLRRSAGMRPV
jgi:hypothetical protein